MSDSRQVTEQSLALIPEGEVDLVLFKNQEIRKVFHNGEWWFSVVDVIGALTGSQRARKYWSDLKRQLIGKEGFSELSDFIGQLPLPGADGKAYPTDVATTETHAVPVAIGGIPLTATLANAPRALQSTARLNTRC